MVIDIGARVITRDGKRAGSVGMVVLEPRTGEITHVVLHKGTILTRDVVVPVSAVRDTRNHNLHLVLTSAELGTMPDFVETEYVVPQQASPTGPYVPGDVLWPIAYAYAPGVIQEEKHVPPNSVEITEGTEVECTDGRIGVVDEVVISELTGVVIGLKVKSQARGTHSVTLSPGARQVARTGDGVLPVSWVEYADAEVVKLNRSKSEVEDYLRSEDIRG